MTPGPTRTGVNPVGATDATLVQRRVSLESSCVLDVDDTPTPTNRFGYNPDFLGGPKPRDVVGPYAIVREVGSGGMGVVFEAIDQRLRRRAALKMIRGGVGVSPDAVRRFQTEAEAVAQTQHPNIVQIYDSGTHEGQPYLAFEYLPGGSLYSQSHNKPRPAREAATLVRTIADAIHHAHTHGVIHRDLKPANILFTADGVPKVTDFGAARLTQDGPDSGTSAAALTRVGEVIGTPQYMAPEQARGLAGSIAPAIDIYALGALLYQLLTGRPPHDGADPYEVLNSVVKNDPVPPRRLVPRLPRDLETICLKALEKSPARRYESAKAMAEDLARYLAGDSILAKPDTMVVRLWKKARRKPVIAGLAVSLVLVALLGLSGVIWQWRQALAARDASARDAAYALEAEGRAMLEAVKVREESRRTANLLYRSRVSEIALMLESGDTEHARKLLFDSRDAPDDRNQWEWHYLNRLGNNHLWNTNLPLADPNASEGVLWTHNMALSPDGRTLAISAGNPYLVANHDYFVPATLFLVDVETGRIKAIWRDYLPEHAETLAWIDDHRIAANTPGRHGVRVYRVENGEMIFGIGRSVWTYVSHTCLSADGRLAAQVTDERTVAVINLDEQRVLRELKLDHPIIGLPRTMQSRDHFHFTVNHQGGASVIDGANGKVVAALPSMVHRSAVSPDGGLYACETATLPHFKPLGLDVWNLADGKREWSIPRSGDFGSNEIRFSPDGEYFVQAYHDSLALCLFQARTGQVECEFRGHTNRITDFCFSPDGRFLASASNDATARVWNIRERNEMMKFRGHATGVRSVRFDPSCRRLYTGGMDGSARAWDLSRETADGNRLPYFPGMEKTGGGAFLGGLWCLADGKARLLDTTYARMAIFDPVTAHVQSIVQFEGMKLRGEKVATDFALSGDGQILVGPPANLSGPLTVWNATTGKKLNEFTSIPGRITAAACNADGTRAAFSTVTIENHRVTRRDFVIVNPRTGEILRHEQTQGFGYPALAFNAAGDMLYMGLYSHTASDNGLRMLDLRTYETFDLPFERKTMVRNLGLSHDGRLLAAMDYADDDDGQKIWMIDLEERKILWKQNHVGPVTGFAFSPNGRRLAAARYDQVIILYDSQTGEEAFVKRIPGMRPGDYAYPARAAFSPDGRSLMMSQFWSRISIWRTDRWNATPKEAFAERRAEAAASAEAFHLRGLRDAITTDPDSPALRPHREWFERQKQMNK